MAGKFNINNLLGGTPAGAGEGAAERETQERPALKVIAISINDLIPSSDNFYSVEHITELKNSIEMFGVLQNLTVKPLEGGKYRIIAGHRRHRACAELVAEGKTEYEYVPCGIQAERDEIKERILLIMTNSTTRELSDWERMKQAEELNKYFSILKKRDNLPGRVRDLVAEALNTSSTQVARMGAIAKNLTPELTAEFKAGRLGLSAAYELSGMDQDRQREALTEYQEKGGLSINDVREKKQEAAEPSAAQGEAPAPTDADSTDADLMREIEQGEEKAWEDFKNTGKNTPAPVPSPAAAPAPRPERTYPETPPDFEEGEAEEQDAPEKQDFADMSELEQVNAAISFLNSKRFTLFAPGEDTRIYDFIIEALETLTGYADENGGA